MARRSEPESAEDRAIREIDDEDEKALDRLVREAGPPPDADRLSEAQEDELWAVTDPLVDADPDAFAATLMTQGIDQQTLARLRVLKEHPEWAQMYGQPTQDAALADQLTRMAQAPHRWTLLIDIDDPAEQTRKAESLDRRYQRKHAALAGAAPEPPAPPLASAPVPAAPPPGYQPDAGAAAMPLSPETPPAAPESAVPGGY